MHVVIFAGGTIRPGKAVQAAIDSADLVIAADRGAASALQHGCQPAIIVGDFDSLDDLPLQTLKERGCEIIQAAVEKDETDAELAIRVAIERGASEITLLGALGGARIDHTIANILLLIDFETTPIRIADGPAVCWLLRGPGHSTIEGHAGDLLSLFPLAGDAAGVSTTGLYYPLHNDTLRFGRPRGVSNALTSDQAVVSLEQGLLLIIHTDSQELQE